MLKFAGILMIFIAGTGMGTAKSMELTKRERNLKKFLWLTSCLKGTVRCGNSCFPEAFLEISEKFDGMYQEFLQSLADRLKGQEGQTLGQIFRDCAKKSSGPQVFCRRNGTDRFSWRQAWLSGQRNAAKAAGCF